MTHTFIIRFVYLTTTFRYSFSMKNIAFLNCVYCIAEFVCEVYWAVSFYRASSVSSSRVESGLCRQTPCVTLWPRPLKMSSASSWASWMMQQSVLYVWLQREKLVEFQLSCDKICLYLCFHFEVELYTASWSWCYGIMSQCLKHVCYTPILIGYRHQVTSQVQQQGI